MSAKDLEERRAEYMRQTGLRAPVPLGWGLHGMVWGVQRKSQGVPHVLKLHRLPAPYSRERDCYLRLRETAIHSIDGVNVPELIQFSDDWLAIEMSVVKRPFLLDFGAAWLDERPDFPPETWEQAEADAAEKFGDDWPEACRILRALESESGIIMGDVHPGNLRLHR